MIFTTVSVAEAPPVEFCVDPSAGDPVAAWFLDHGWIDEFVHRVFHGLVEPGVRVVDLGAHLGTFSLSAAALGADVIAVDASPRHAELLRLAVERNGFEGVHAVNGAVSTSRLPVAFIEQSIHGRVALPTDSQGTTIVDPVTIDGLLRRFGWDGVDLVKLDIEGAEYSALDGMRDLFAAGERPEVVFECNGAMLPLFGGSVDGLRARFERLGYELFLIDNLRPGVLVEAPSDALQPECVSDYVATVNGRDRLAARWQIEPRFTEPVVVSRLLEQAASAAVGYRRYAAQTLRAAPRWLRDNPAAAIAARTLELDCDQEVRDTAAPPRSRSSRPRRGSPPPDLAVFAQGVSLRAHRSELDHVHRRSGRDPRPILEGVSFHVRRGQLVGLYSDSQDAASALLRALAGYDRPIAGELHVQSPAVLLGDLAEVLELDLSVLDNLEILAAFLGGHVPESGRWIGHVAAQAGLGHRLDAALRAMTGQAVIQLALGAALVSARGPLLLIDRLPPANAPGFHDWAIEQTWQLRRKGVAVVQSIASPDELLGPADRLLWLHGSELVACGNADAVLDAVRRRALRLDRQPVSRYWAAS